MEFTNPFLLKISPQNYLQQYHLLNYWKIKRQKSF